MSTVVAQYDYLLDSYLIIYMFILAVSEVATFTSLQSTSECGELLGQMLRDVKKFNIKKFHKFQQSGLEEDDYNEVLCSLDSMQMLYSPTDIDMH